MGLGIKSFLTQFICSTSKWTALINITFIIPIFYGLFLLLGFFYQGIFYSNYTHYRIDSFYKSESRTSKISSVLLGNWDRVCYLQSHKTIDLEAILNRKLNFPERLFWNFRVDFVDFDHDGGVMVYEKSNNIQEIEFPGIFFSSKSQGCYKYANTYLKKSSTDRLIIYSTLN